MSTRAKIASALASIGVLAIGWQVGTANGQTVATTTPTTTTSNGSTSSTAGTGTSTSTSTSSSSGSSSSGSSGSSSSSSSASSSSSSSLQDGTYTGTTATDRYGSVTVGITVANGKITAVNATSTATDGHSAQINSRAIPVLKSETLTAQGADISTVGGATYTSDAYITSLQSALDQAAA